jgi:hypothetical protein
MLGAMSLFVLNDWTAPIQPDGGHTARYQD